MPTISEPKTEATDWTYRVSLQIMGLSPRDAETEVNLARMEKRR